MKVRKGWLVSVNDETHSMIPFFVHVRAKDIVVTEEIKIEELLTQCSMRWTLTEKLNDIIKTHYRYAATWDNLSDPNNEELGCEKLDATVDYDFYLDGRLIVTWTGIAKGTLATSSTDSTKKESHRTLYLPYSLPDNTKLENTLNASVIGGTPRSILLGATLDNAGITNVDLIRTAGSVYPFKISLDLQAPNSIGSAQDISWKAGYIAGTDKSPLDDYDAYINHYIPLQIVYTGHWSDIGVIAQND